MELFKHIQNIKSDLHKIHVWSLKIYLRCFI
jgi:hypothetical protein